MKISSIINVPLFIPAFFGGAVFHFMYFHCMFSLHSWAVSRGGSHRQVSCFSYLCSACQLQKVLHAAALPVWCCRRCLPDAAADSWAGLEVGKLTDTYPVSENIWGKYFSVCFLKFSLKTVAHHFFLLSPSLTRMGQGSVLSYLNVYSNILKLEFK